MKLQPKEFFLQPFLTRLMKIFKMRAEQQRIAFEQHFIPGLPGKIVADEQRLRQILLNLLGNAFKFTRQGQVTFKIAPLYNQDHHVIRKLRFQVEDTGIGIPADQLENIFAAFHQIGKKRLAETEGVGLGLTVSQRLARMMNSELHVQSTVGKGSIFWFDLDIIESEIQTSEPASEEQEEESQESLSTPEKEPQIIPPSPEILHKLWEYLNIGDIMEIREYVEQLPGRDQNLRPFVAKVTQLAESLNITELRTFLQQYVEGDQESHEQETNGT
jgi:hypothetical protein